MEGPWCRFRREREPVSDIDTAAADSLKVLDPKWPIREADTRATVVNLLLVTDSVEKVPNLKSLQICQNANDIFD